MSHLCLVLVLFGMLSFLLQSIMKSLDSVIELLLNGASV